MGHRLLYQSQYRLRIDKYTDLAILKSTVLNVTQILVAIEPHSRYCAHPERDD
jgi:hypothetical protein